jgi:RNA polymerase sigma-70 factor (ECF subfamily)
VLSNERFATTRWSIVLGAGGGGNRADAGRALAALCETYWPPLYAFLRRSGSSPADAEDTVQGFFALLLARDDLARLQPERGRFRSFLLAALKHYRTNERDKAAALKRGGGRQRVSLDAGRAEARYGVEPADRRTPESLFDYCWAQTVLENTMAQLRASYQAAGKEDRFEVLAPHLAGERAESYREAAARLGLTEGAVKVAVHRMRKEYRELIRAEIAQTVASEEEIDGEIEALFDALRS